MSFSHLRRPKAAFLAKGYNLRFEYYCSRLFGGRVGSKFRHSCNSLAKNLDTLSGGISFTLLTTLAASAQQQ